MGFNVGKVGFTNGVIALVLIAILVLTGHCTGGITLGAR